MQRTREEVAERFQVHVRTVDRWIRGGLLQSTETRGPGLRRRVEISDEAIAAFRKAHRPSTAAR